MNLYGFLYSCGSKAKAISRYLTFVLPKEFILTSYSKPAAKTAPAPAAKAAAPAPAAAKKFVPESILKKRKANEKNAAERVAKAIATKKVF